MTVECKKRKHGVCFIAGAGEMTARGLSPKAGDLLLAADGGAQGLRRLGLTPHVLVGDLDSFAGSLSGQLTLRFPVRKDDTDLSLAVKLGLSLGYGRFRLYGCSGGPRTDHFLAALQLMAGFSRAGLRLHLVAPGFDVFALSDGAIVLPSAPGQTFSILSASGESRSVRLEGLSYAGEHLSLSGFFPLGVSNSATGRRVMVSVRKGSLLIYRQRMETQALLRST